MDWQKVEERVIGWRRDLHRIPEIGLKVPQTASYICGVLDELGISYHTLLEGNAVVALIEGARPGKCLALRADTDGLEIVEETGLPFASINGCMHACGHDAHTAMLLGAAMWLNDQRSTLQGSVKFLFQPGEEYPGGARPMVEAGCLESPKVDAVAGLHTGSVSAELEPGKIGFKSGPLMAAVDTLFITVQGKGGHAAYPETTIDPIPVAAEIVLAIQTVVSRTIAPADPAVISIGKISGGQSMNVIPDRVELVGTVRTTNQQTREGIAERIRTICEHIASAHGATVTVRHDFIYPALLNDAEMTELAMEAAAEIVGQERIQLLERPVMGAEDFSCFAEQVPSVYYFQYAMEADDGEVYGHHNSRFRLDESRLIEGSKLHCGVALKYLNGTVSI